MRFRRRLSLKRFTSPESEAAISQVNADYQMIRLQERIAQLEQALAKLEVIQTFLPIILHKRKKSRCLFQPFFLETE